MASKAQMQVDMALENKDNLLELFEELTEKYQKRVYKQAIRKSLKTLLKETKEEFNAVKKGQSVARGGKQPSLGNYIEVDKTFKIKMYRRKAGAMVGAIGGKAYKVRWINFGVMAGGKEDRRTRKGNRKPHLTGVIEPSNFFYKAVDRLKAPAMQSVERNLIISMDKLVRKFNSKK